MYGGGQFSQNDDTASSPQRGGRKAIDEQTVTPVTIRMILNATMDTSGVDGGGVMLRDGRSVHLVKFIGAVRGVEDLSTNVVFSMEDGTGLTDVKQWHDPSDCAGIAEMRMQASQDSVYVRVIGQLKAYEGKITVVGMSVRRVSTCNELTHHFLETAHSSEKSKRNQLAPQQQQSTNVYNSSMGATPFGATSNYGAAPAQSRQQPVTAQSSMNGMTDAARGIMDYIKNPTNMGNPSGCNKTEVMKALSNRFQESQMREAFDQLANNGMIYSTIDDAHFQVC